MNTPFCGTTEDFLAQPFALLHIPRCVAIARSAIEEDKLRPKAANAVRALIDAAERADWTWTSGPSYHDNEAAFDANVTAMNAAGLALLKAVKREYT